MPRKPIEERFWSKVVKSEGCWEWTAALFKKTGYAVFTDNHRVYRGHRVAWRLVNGPIPDGMHVCHRCDNRKCVRPDHLFLGTHQDNMADRDAKGRQAFGARSARALHPETTARGERHGAYTKPWTRRRGELNGRAKLTESDVRAIRAEPHRYGIYSELARRYGVSHVMIMDIRNGYNWKHVV